MAIKYLKDSAFVKVMLYLYEKGDARFSELHNDISISKSTLTYVLKETQNEQLIERNVIDTRPVQTRYSLTTQGRELAQHLKAIQNIITD